MQCLFLYIQFKQKLMCWRQVPVSETVSDYIIMRSSWSSLKSRRMFDQSVRTDHQSMRDTAWSNGGKKTAYACTVRTFTLCAPHFPTDTSNQSLHPHCADFPGIYMKSLAVLKICLKKSMTPFIFFQDVLLHPGKTKVATVKIAYWN